jgi:hypothetical protein
MSRSRVQGQVGVFSFPVAADAAPLRAVEGWRVVLAVLIGMSVAVRIMSSPTASATTKPDACAALTPAMASRILGARSTSPEDAS